MTQKFLRILTISAALFIANSVSAEADEASSKNEYIPLNTNLETIIWKASYEEPNHNPTQPQLSPDFWVSPENQSTGKIQEFQISSINPKEFYNTENPEAKTTILWAACNITSEIQGKILTGITTDCDTEIFSNGAIIGKYENGLQQINSSYLCEIPLQKGSNLITLRLTLEGSQKTQIYVNSWTCLNQALEAITTQKISIIDPLISTNPEEIKLNYKTNISKLSLPVSIEDAAGLTLYKKITENDKKSWMPPLKTGIYKISLHIEAKTYTEWFGIGSIKELANTFPPPQTADQEVQQVRLETLISPPKLKKGNKVWQLQFINTLSSAANSAIESNQSTIPNGVNRIQYAGVKSQIDDQTLGYRLYTPSSINGATHSPVPLIIILSAPLENEMPFIKSPLAYDHLTAIEIAKAAEKFQAAILWPGYRTNPSGQPLEMQHLIEIISDVEKRIPINPKKISLIARCAAGITAGMAISDFTDKFASTVFIKAYFENGVREIDYNQFIPFPAFKKWMQLTSPPALIMQSPQSAPRFLILHDGKPTPGHGELMWSKKFIEQCKSNNIPVEYSLNGTLLNSRNAWEYIIKWVSTKTKENPGNTHENIYKRISKSGPIQKFFSKPFIIVTGTTENEKEQEAIERTAKDLAVQWQEKNFSSCQILADIDLENSKELHNKNLILIGNNNCNKIWNKLNINNRIKIDASGILINGTKFDGDEIAIQAITPNPLNDKCSILLLGCHNIMNLKYGRMDLFYSGWYDYSIWQTTPDVKIKHADYYE